MTAVQRIEISPKDNKQDAVSRSALARFRDLVPTIEDVTVVRVLTIRKDISRDQFEKVADAAQNPVTESWSLDPTPILNYDFALEVGFLPGVTDNVGHTTKELIEDLLKISFGGDDQVASSTLYLFKGDASKAELDKLKYALHNDLIQRAELKTAAEYGQNGMLAIVPTVKLAEKSLRVTEVDLDLTDEDLAELGKKGILDPETGERRGPLALSLLELQTIRDYFKKEGRKPTDVELESLAQTWSEHCKHKIFASPLDDDLPDGLYRTYIKQATKDVRSMKGDADFCVSVFKDNSGAIKFNDDYYLTDKAETHNTPSALDPFGGAITGIVGVNRDTLGFGLGAKPVANRYGFCFADPRDQDPLYRDKDQKQMLLAPGRIAAGVIKGTEAGGNQSGIPAPQGFIYYNERYKGKPLVFVGTVGLIPKEIAGQPSTEKAAKSGDLVVVIGGRVGQDGIHGATFSSEGLDEGSPSTAVQIGDPITQKRFLDAILTEARELGLYHSITDNGAGGISCSVAEMAEQCGGCEVDLETVPLKYANLEPWKIWISESQERMTLAVSEQNWPKFAEIMQKHAVEATVIGKFTDSGRCQVKYNGELIMDLAMDFLHDGVPLPKLTTTYTKPQVVEPQLPAPADYSQSLLDMVGRLNVASHAYVSTIFDHEVIGQTIIKPLQGRGKVNAPATVIKPDYNSWAGAVMSQGLNPLYSDIDTYKMAACAIDMAIRNAVAVGGNVDHMALMDNFCWCSSDEPERLGQLKAAAQACYDYAVAFGTPYISGKDSMFNDFKGFDAKGNPTKISVPPTLLISSLAVMPDVRKALTMDPKVEGDLVYLVGTTKNELGGSEYYYSQKQLGANVPEVDSKAALKTYREFYAAVAKGLIASAASIGLGGLGVTLAKMAIAGQLGLTLDLQPARADLEREDQILYSETPSRFVVTVNPQLQMEFESAFKESDLYLIGTVTSEPKLLVTGFFDQEIINLPIQDLAGAYFASNKFYE